MSKKTITRKNPTKKPETKKIIPAQSPNSKVNTATVKSRNKRLKQDKKQTQSESKHNSTATTDRQWQLLTQLERSRWRGTHHIHEQLRLAGFDVSLRTIQRDLNALSSRFPIEKNNANPQGWRWKEDAPVQSLPHMSLSQAVAFNMVEANLAQLLPPAILEELFPWFDLARQQLKDSTVAHTWLDRVRIESATQPLIAPEICRKCKDAIYEAIFYGRQITASYTRRNKDNAGVYALNPLAIIQRGVVIYLLATRVDDAESLIRTFALHRFTEVTVEDNEAIVPPEFDLSAYLDAGGMGFVHPLFRDRPDRGKDIKVKLVFNGGAGSSLTESRLSEDQEVIEDEDNNTQTITATVNLTSQLVWWLRGFGKKLSHIEPDILAQAVHQDDSRL